MRILLALRELLEQHGGLERGAIATIERETGIDRKALSALMANRVRYVSLDHLGAIAEYLIAERGVPVHELPGRLLRREQTDLWTLLAERARIDTCVGGRRDDDVAGDRAWVMLSDSKLENALTLHITMHGMGAGAAVRSMLNRHVVPAPRRDGSDWDVIESVSREVYASFARGRDDRAFVSVGSVKSNPVSELILARAFGVEAFTAPTDDEVSAGRGCPFFMVYRPNDPHVTSCWAGTELPPSPGRRGRGRGRRTAPGLYYLSPEGRWMHAPSTDDLDAALIFFVNRPAERRLEIVAGGFTGLATEVLARHVPKLGPDDLKVGYHSDAVEVAGIVARFEYKDRAARSGGGGFPGLPEFTVTLDHVAPEVLSSRLVPREGAVR